MSKFLQDIPDINTRMIWVRSADGETDISAPCAVCTINTIQYLQNKSTRPIIINISSLGGDYDCGMAIYDAIKTCRCKTIMIGYGAVCSAAAVIFQAADRRYLTPNAYLMLHLGSVEIASDVMAMHQWSKMYELQTKQMLEILASRMIKSKQFSQMKPLAIQHYLLKQFKTKGDVILSPKDAIDCGLADKILAKWPPSKF